MTPLVLAKAPVPGRVKTRLGADVGADVAADLAAAALLDTLDLVEDALGRGVVALDGELAEASRGEELTVALAGWRVVPQRGDELGERIAHAHADVDDVVVQVGMDTPHLSPEQLRETADRLREADAVLGPAEDGGWWVLALNDPGHAALVRDVPTSRVDTGRLTLEALSREIVVALGPHSYDVDTIDDARRSADDAPHTRFAHTWRSR
ncbi:DUF2064 domain-containing protein [Nocardioides mangrovicus]|uniref:DUF2064 domain-containing protein n=1 Tax=Nocardioides mangrovicus TaxID=2478913 RepID=A0A3L8P3S7_9ACTN|nr:DUF2064 domain-containing protein [Nocardioides mangrovicus]RLV49078.1 DUF2064 domain-containing protein [Nocardioides mangrovicus]